MSTTTTSTTEVPQIVGKYPGELPVLGSAAGLFVVIVAAGTFVTFRARRTNAAKAGPDAAVAGTPAPKRGGG